MSIQDQITRLNTAKNNILKAISNKGVDTSSVSTLDDIPTLIDSITTKEDLDSELTQQTNLLSSQGITIDDIKEALKGKGSGGGSGETPEYTRVGYIQFTGKQTVDTGIICNQDTKIRALFTREATSQDYFYGVTSSDNTASVTAYLGGTWRFGNKSASKGNYVAANNDIIYTSIVDNTQIHIPNNKTAISGVNDFETVGSLTIGSCRSASGALTSPQFIGKLYLFEMWQGEEQVLKLEPVVNKDGVYGFWDAISETFLTSITNTPLEGEV